MDQEASAGKSGMGCFTLLVLCLVLVMIAFLGIDEAIGFYGAHCGDASLIDCILNKTDTMQLTPSEKESMVTATGNYTYSGYTVTLTAHIPLSGGPVTGEVTGACEGKMKGTFNGEDLGEISGSMAGACNVFFVNTLASATLNGTVDESQKKVPINFTGKGAGLTHQGSMTLSY